MSKMKKLLALLLAAVLCLSMAACGGSTDDVAGDDWRVSGVVAGSGTITHDGESVDVLVTVSPTRSRPSTPSPSTILTATARATFSSASSMKTTTSRS